MKDAMMKLNPYKKNDPSYLFGSFVFGGLAGAVSLTLMLPFSVPFTLYICEVGTPSNI